MFTAAILHAAPELPDETRRECLIELKDDLGCFLAKYNEITDRWMPAFGVPNKTLLPQGVARWAYLDELMPKRPGRGETLPADADPAAREAAVKAAQCAQLLVSDLSELTTRLDSALTPEVAALLSTAQGLAQALDRLAGVVSAPGREGEA